MPSLTPLRLEGSRAPSPSPERNAQGQATWASGLRGRGARGGSEEPPEGDGRPAGSASQPGPLRRVSTHAPRQKGHRTRSLAPSDDLWEPERARRVRGAGGKRRGLTLHGKGLASAPYRQRALEGTGRLGRKSRQAVFRPGAGGGTTRTRGRSSRRRQPWHGRTRTTRRGAGSVSESSRGRHHTPRKSRGPILGVARRTRHPKPSGRG